MVNKETVLHGIPVLCLTGFTLFKCSQSSELPVKVFNKTQLLLLKQKIRAND